MERDTISLLYEKGELLDEAESDRIQEYEDAFRYIMNCAHGTATEKILASQLIVKYAKFFPNLQDEASNKLIDLCEEEDLAIRVHTIRGFPHLCQDIPNELLRMTDVLLQLLSTDQQLELDAVKTALEKLLTWNTTSTLDVIFRCFEIGSGPESSRAINFLREAIKHIAPESLHPKPKVEMHLAILIRLVLIEVPVGEQEIFIEILKQLKIMADEKNRKIFDLLAAYQATNVPHPWMSTDETVNNFVSVYNPTNAGGFAAYISTRILPSFSELSETNKVKLLRLFCEIPPFVTQLDAEMALPSLHKLIKLHLPAPTAISPKINFTYVECILYIFHNVAAERPLSLKTLLLSPPLPSHKQAVEAKRHTNTGSTAQSHTNSKTGNFNKLPKKEKNSVPRDTHGEGTMEEEGTKEEDVEEQREDFKKRTIYLKENTEMYISKLESSGTKGSGNSSNTSTGGTLTLDQVTEVALKTTKNINYMAVCLLKPNPKLISRNSKDITLSWKSVGSPKGGEALTTSLVNPALKVSSIRQTKIRRQPITSIGSFPKTPIEQRLSKKTTTPEQKQQQQQPPTPPPPPPLTSKRTEKLESPDVKSQLIINVPVIPPEKLFRVGKTDITPEHNTFHDDHNYHQDVDSSDDVGFLRVTFLQNGKRKISVPESPNKRQKSSENIHEEFFRKPRNSWDDGKGRFFPIRPGRGRGVQRQFIGDWKK